MKYKKEEDENNSKAKSIADCKDTASSDTILATCIKKLKELKNKIKLTPNKTRDVEKMKT